MKNTLRTLVTVFLVAAGIMSGCLSSRNADATRNNEQNSKEKIAEAKHTRHHEMITSLKQFKQESERSIALYEKNIAALKTRISDEKLNSKEEYGKRLSDLETQNNNLKRKLRAYEDDGKDNWDVFRSEVNHTLDSVGESLSDFFSTE